MDLGTPINYVVPAITKLIEFFQNTAVITASAALLGVYLSNKASERRIAIQFEQEAKARAIALKSVKIEELFIILKSIDDYIDNVYRIMKPYIYGKIDYDQAMFYIGENLAPPMDENQRLHAVAILYFPTLKVELENFVKARSEMISSIDRFSKKRNKLTPEQFNQLFKNFRNHSEIFSDKIVKVATEIN
jgi:hypothetical protein